MTVWPQRQTARFGQGIDEEIRRIMARRRIVGGIGGDRVDGNQRRLWQFELGAEGAEPAIAIPGIAAFQPGLGETGAARIPLDTLARASYQMRQTRILAAVGNTQAGLGLVERKRLGRRRRDEG